MHLPRQDPHSTGAPSPPSMKQQQPPSQPPLSRRSTPLPGIRDEAAAASPAVYRRGGRCARRHLRASLPATATEVSLTAQAARATRRVASTQSGARWRGSPCQDSGGRARGAWSGQREKHPGPEVMPTGWLYAFIGKERSSCPQVWWRWVESGYLRRAIETTNGKITIRKSS
jgi:hypothetical protein